MIGLESKKVIKIQDEKGLITTSKTLYKTGLTKSVLEYIDSISFGSDYIYSEFSQFGEFVDYIFRTDDSKLSKMESSNRYWSNTSDFSPKFLNMDKSSRIERKELLFQYFKEINRKSSICFGSDVLFFNLSNRFYPEYNSLEKLQKDVVTQMLFNYGMDIYSEYLRSNVVNEVTYALILHVDEGEFHIHRLFGSHNR